MTANTQTDSESTATTDRELTIQTPAESRPDEEIAIRITGATPGEPVDFEASMTDGEGDEWRSQATFTADSAGVVDLTEQAPDAGTYEGVDPMGWLWSMQPDSEEQLVLALMDTATKTVQLRASTDEQATECRIERGFDESQFVRREVDSDSIVGTVFEPAEAGPHPGVLVLHGSSGHAPLFEAALLASHGFAAFALQYIGDPDPLSEEIRQIPLSYFERGAEWFRSQSSVTDEPLGIVGHSRGAEIGLRLGARYDWAGAVVSYAGSTVLWDTPSGDPAWLDEDGDPLPAVPGRGKPTLTDGQLDAASAETREAAMTPVEDIDGPVLFVSGSEDPIWPARRLAAMGVERLKAAEFEHPFEHVTDDEAGHFITPPYLPKAHHVFGGTPAGMARADADAWPTVLEYLSAGTQ